MKALPAAALLLLSCGNDGTLVKLHVHNLPDGTASLSVCALIGGAPAFYSASKDDPDFRIRLPARGFQGDVPLYVDAVAADGCALIRASATARVDGGGGEVTLDLPPSQDEVCPVSIHRQGAGGGTFQFIEGAAQVAACPPDAAYVPRGGAITIAASDADNSHFGGYGPPCAGGARRCRLGAVTGRVDLAARFDLGVCTAENVCWEYPLLQGNPLYGAFAGSTAFWSVGGGGTVLVRKNEGQGFRPITGLANDLHGVAGAGPDVWVAGDGGLLARFDGVRFAVPEGSGKTTANLRGVFALPGLVWAVGERSEIVFGNVLDLGKGWVAGNMQWNELSPNDGTNPLPALYRIGAIAGDRERLVAPADNGKVQVGRSVGFGPPRDCADGPLYGLFAGAQGAWLVGKGGLVASFDGTKCTVSMAQPAADLFAIAADGMDLWAAGAEGALRRGPDFRAAASPFVSALRDLAGTPAGGLWVVGDGGVIAREQGGSWAVDPAVTPDAADARPTLHALSGRGRSGLFAVGENGAILRWSGTVWQAEAGNDPMRRTLRGAYATAERAWAVGDGGVVLERGDGGWSAIAGPPGRRRLNAVVANDTHLWVAGEQRAVFRRPLSGGDWEPANPNTSPKEYYALFSSGPLVCVAGEIGMPGETNVYCSRNGSPMAWDFQNTPGGATLYSLWGTGPDDLWAAGEGVIYHRSQNMPTAWSPELSAPGDSLRAGATYGGAHLVVGIGGAVYRRDANGKSFARLPGGTHLDLYGALAVPSEGVLFAGAGGAVLRYVP